MTRNVTWMVLGQGLNFFLQAAYFVLLARFLGATQYGIFAGCFALVNLVAPYSALGAGMLFMRYVSQDRTKAGVYWGNTLLVTLAGSTFIAVIVAFVGPGLTRTGSPLIFVILSLANCLFSQISALASLVFQTYERMKIAAALAVAANLVRFLILVCMMSVLHRATVLQWSMGVLLASAIAAGFSVVMVQRTIDRFRVDLKLLRSRALEGIGFSFAGTTQAVNNDIDKTMLSHYGLIQENGFYSLAYRIVDFSTTPVQAIDSAALPRIFQIGHRDIVQAVKFALRSAGVATLVGLAIGVTTWCLAPLVPRLVGRDFGGILQALRWLCWLPALRGINRLAGSALTGTGHQRYRTTTQLLIAAINVAMNVLWIPRYGWIGAAWSSVICDGLLGVLNLLVLFYLWKSLKLFNPLTPDIPNPL
jgi:O-antigen/teichoic acid export membrane protein